MPSVRCPTGSLAVLQARIASRQAVNWPHRGEMRPLGLLEPERTDRPQAEQAAAADRRQAVGRSLEDT